MHKYINITITILMSIIFILLFSYGCGNAAGNSESDSPIITSVVAEHNTLYPLGNTSITCSAVSRDGSSLNYRWSCNDGIIRGEGPTINWEAPRTYGDFQIIVQVDDGKGHVASKTAIVTVIVRDPSKCCR